MAGNQITTFIFISSVLLHTHLADVQYSAVMPKTITALTGSCVQIPCAFNISEFEDIRKKTKSFIGIWLKKIPQYANADSFIAFNSSKNISKAFSGIQMTGNLTERNCTTVFYNITSNHSDPYYFRLETQPDEFKATFNTNQMDSRISSMTVRIDVRESPMHPEIQPKNLSYVMEGSTVNLSCSADAPCPKHPPNISWSKIFESANIKTQLLENPDKTQSVFSYMTFNASYRDHRNNISCKATYSRETFDDSTVETTLTLYVLFPPKETYINIYPSASVSVGTNMTLTCKSKASPSNNMTYIWYKHGQERPIALGKKLIFNATQYNTGSFFCTAQNKHGNQSSKLEAIQLISDGESVFSHYVIYGCTGGLLAFILLSAACFYCMRIKTSGQVSNQATDENRDTVAIYANNDILIRKKNENKEAADLHYGEIDFSKLTTDYITKDSSNNCPQTEYAEIKVIEKEKANGQTDDFYSC